jgi:hypothetical protein
VEGRLGNIRTESWGKLCLGEMLNVPLLYESYRKL